MEEKIHKDFHGALSVGFEYLAKKFGKKSLEEFLGVCARSIYKELIKKIKKEGLIAIEKYWNEIFSLEGAKFKIERKKGELILKITECPAISHIVKVGYPVYDDFCIQCRVINRVIAEETGLKSEISSDQKKGRCIQKFKKEIQ
ncbi:MAG: hypothetical protein NC905_00950 [Candidatus Omnitrophica bacterium]|nr:hypothetical protein [Candidatus Omnitrophota bacterium]MCM8776824.1 hypothetical protein [Candidatus Omnitrophota bacterium]